MLLTGTIVLVTCTLMINSTAITRWVFREKQIGRYVKMMIKLVICIYIFEVLNIKIEHLLLISQLKTHERIKHYCWLLLVSCFDWLYTCLIVVAKWQLLIVWREAWRKAMVRRSLLLPCVVSCCLYNLEHQKRQRRSLSLCIQF